MITFVTTFYNSDPSLLKRTLWSLLNQKERFKHIIYNDGSVKNISENIKIINEYKKILESSTSSKVIFINESVNMGVDLAHGKLFKIVDTEYFMWLDVGDYLISNSLSYIYKKINRNKKSDIFHLNDKCFYDGKYDKRTTASKKAKFCSLRRRNQLANVFTGYNFYYHFFVVKTSSFIKWFSSFDIVDGTKFNYFYYDAQIMHIACLNNARFSFLGKVCGFIEENPNSVSRSVKSKPNEMNKFDYLRMYIASFESMCKKGSIYIDFYSMIKPLSVIMRTNNVQEAIKQYKKEHIFMKKNHISYKFHPYYRSQVKNYFLCLIRRKK